MTRELAPAVTDLAHTPPAEGAAGRLPQPESSGRLRAYLIAVLASFIGDWFTTVALLTALYVETGSALGPAVFLMARYGPRLVGNVGGGWLADRLAPRNVLVAIACGQAVLGLLTILFLQQSWVGAIYLSAAASALLGAGARPAQFVVLTQLVPQHRLARATAFYTAVFAGSLAIGPALAAPLLLVSSPSAMIAADVATFCVAAVLLVLAVPARGIPTAVERTPGLSGLPALAGDRTLRTLAAVVGGMGMTAAALQAVLPSLASRWPGGESAVGWCYAAVGAGSLVGIVLAARWRPRPVSARWLCASLLIGVAGLLVCAAGAPLWAALLGVAAQGAAADTVEVWGFPLVPHRVPEDAVGRVMGGIFSVLLIELLIGALIVLVLHALLGDFGVVALAAGLSVSLTAVAAFPWQIRRSWSPESAALEGPPGRSTPVAFS